MRKLYTLLMALMLLFSINASSQELLSNTTFGDLTGWTETTVGEGSGIVDPADTHTDDGSSSYLLFSNGTYNSHIQSGYLSPGAGDYILSFYVKSAVAGARVLPAIYQGAWVNGDLHTTTTTDWELVEHTFTLSENSFNVRIKSNTNDPSADKSFQIDDVSLKSASEPVEPVERLDYTFDDVNDVEGFVGANGVTLSQTISGTLTVTIDDTQSYPKLEQSSGLYTVNADLYKAVEITLINASPKNLVTFVSTEGGNQFKTAEIITDPDNSQTVIIELTESDNWTGTQSNWFLQLKEDDGGLVASAGTIHIEQILFTEVNTTGIDDVGFMDDNSIALYPNPVKDMLTIETSSRIEKIEVFSINGKLSIVQNGFSNKLDASSLSEGVYILKIHQENNKISTKRFIKN